MIMMIMMMDDDNAYDADRYAEGEDGDSGAADDDRERVPCLFVYP